MAVEWTSEKITACAVFFGKLPWRISVGDKCVKRTELFKDQPQIELVNSIGPDAFEFMKDKVWLLTSDDIENILLERGWILSTHTSKIPDVGGLLNECTVSVSDENGTSISANDHDPHFARIKLLQRVFQQSIIPKSIV